MSEAQPQYKPEIKTVALEERRLLDFFRDDLKFGEATVTVRKGLPVFVRVALKDIKLD